MNIKEMNLQDIESIFNLICKMREGILRIANANGNMNTPLVRNINNKYNLVQEEIMSRIDGLYSDNNNTKKEMLNEEVAH